MAKYNLTIKATQDLRQIWNYTFDNWSERQADKYYKEILDQCAILASNPSLGREYKNIYPRLRGSKVNKHLIFYKAIDGTEIEVVRILHQQMDFKKQIIED